MIVYLTNTVRHCRAGCPQPAGDALHHNAVRRSIAPYDCPTGNGTQKGARRLEGKPPYSEVCALLS